MDQYYGEYIVNVARRTIEAWVERGKKYKPSNCPVELYEKRGVFTTLYKYPGKTLRGCIGYAEPIMALKEALVESAISATQDPRFPKLSPKELKKVIVEVSVLTQPQLIKVNDPKEYPKKIRLGEDGLIIEKGPYRGLLLPQVPLEWNWNQEMFLGNLCIKASLSPDQWHVKDVKIYKFQADVFGEEYPNGPVKRVEHKTVEPSGDRKA
jgi:uncharacterized protein (TIGR00296 family)